MTKLIVFDLDGTLYLGDKLRDGTITLLNELKNKRVDYVFYTNTSSKSKERVINKLKRYGIETIDDAVYTNQDAISKFFESKNSNLTVFINSASKNLIFETLNKAGVIVVNDPNETIDYYLQGSNDTFSYNDLEIANDMIRKGATLLATDSEPLYFTKKKMRKPATGWIIAAIEKVVAQTAIIIGKPNIILLEDIAKKRNCLPDEILIVGDSLHTDIEMGRRYGSRTCLVSKGVTLIEDIIDSNIRPDFIVENCNEILEIL
jgi:NagD protein